VRFPAHPALRLPCPRAKAPGVNRSERAAHNGLVAGSGLVGRTTISNCVTISAGNSPLVGWPPGYIRADTARRDQISSAAGHANTALTPFHAAHTAARDTALISINVGSATAD
jgi:hypothetical protein